MAHRYNPLHERLNVIVRRAGGYDFDYHMEKIARENNIDKNIVIKIFCMNTNDETKRKYIELYKEGYSLDYIKRIKDISECKKQLDEAYSRYL